MTAYWKNFHFLQQLLGMSCYHRGGDDQGYINYQPHILLPGLKILLTKRKFTLGLFKKT